MPDAFYTGQTDYLSKLNTLWNYYSGGTQGYPSLHEASGRIYTGSTDNGSTHFQINGSMLASGQVSLGGSVNTEALRVASGSTVNRLQVTGGTTGVGPRLEVFGETTTGMGVYSRGTAPIIMGTNNGTRQVQITNTTSAVNWLNLSGGISGGPTLISSDGASTDVGQYFSTRGGGGYQFTTGSGAYEQFRILHVANASSYIAVAGASSGNSPFFLPQGADANISVNLGQKGRGNIGVNWGLPPARLSIGAQGMTATAVSTISSVNTSTDTLTTSAAHGFTTGDVAFYKSTGDAITVASAAERDRWFFVNAPTTTTLTLHDTLQNAITGSSTKLDISTAGSGTQTLAPATLIITGSAAPGSSNTSNIDTMLYRHTAGSTWTGVTTRIQARTDNTSQGYIEFNPVDNTYGTKIGAISTGVIQLATGGGEQLRIHNIAATATMARIRGGSTGTGPVYEAYSTVDTDVAINIGSQGTGAVAFYTGGYINGTGQRQVQINHVASVANRWEMAGGATGIPPSLNIRGESNTSAQINANGTGSVFLSTGGTAYTNQLEVFNTTSAVDRLRITGSASGNPSIQVGGSTSVGNIVLVPKGGGAVVCDTGGFGNFFRTVSAGSGITVANCPEFTAGATGSRTSYTTNGSDTNRGITIAAAGSEIIDMRANGGSNLVVGGGGSNPINYIQARGSTAGQELKFTAEGQDSHISMHFLPKGSGLITAQADSFRIMLSKTPGSSTATGTQGQVCWDTSFLYVCVGTNSWKRAAISAW